MAESKQALNIPLGHLRLGLQVQWNEMGIRLFEVVKLQGQTAGEGKHSLENRLGNGKPA